MTVKVKVLQNWFDLASIYTGDASNAYQLAFHNNSSITDDLQSGQEIEIPNNITINQKDKKYLHARNLQPATGLTLEQKEYDKPLGIGEMVINSSFIVR
ncbi:hypothetical protein BWK59_05885 [Flavobacterium davisii]|uniref:LysM domain-containing protein n=1 Tax=Flavobacterium davisii TaxID=2906077 RepID=A0A2D0AIL0_9FLAO|nr:hypothetical protein [Flavobacterium davisii]OWP84353.1 hypothetical protein BWK59_05885 [Flavobacterium davisii]